MSKHTPGPWRVMIPPSSTEDSRWIVNGALLCVAHIHWDIKQGEWHANARLIAAAPEMLELLRRIADGWIETRYCGDEAGRGIESASGLARALLARIEGD